MFASPSPSLPLIAALFGVCVGSFLNVVVWRLPRQESLVLPGSHCPRCGTALRWFENLPVLSWLLQGGRCRHCRGTIAMRYPLVELLCAGLWVANSSWADPRPWVTIPQPLLLLLAGWLLLSWLIPLTLIDLDQIWLPEPLCRLGLLLGLLCTAVLGLGQRIRRRPVAAAAPPAGGRRWPARLRSRERTVAERLMGRPALGLGDAKLAALLGAWLGLTGLGLTVVLAVLSGARGGSCWAGSPAASVATSPFPSARSSRPPEPPSGCWATASGCINLAPVLI
jgi:leader peptidase (prepilin peptidase) / N-methyltransferase